MEWEINSVTEEDMQKISKKYFLKMNSEEQNYFIELYSVILMSNNKWKSELQKIKDHLTKPKAKIEKEEEEPEEKEEEDEEEPEEKEEEDEDSEYETEKFTMKKRKDD